MAESSKAQQWAKRIVAFEGSGLNRRAWCRQQGLNPNTLDYWRSRLRRANPVAPGARASAALVPIVVAGGDTAVPDIEIALPSGTRVRARSAVDAAWLSALMRGLSGC
jgi:transposase-like protein